MVFAVLFRIILRITRALFAEESRSEDRKSRSKEIIVLRRIVRLEIIYYKTRCMFVYVYVNNIYI